MLDAQAFRTVMGTFPTGVTVVTVTGVAGDPLGLTVNSFTSVSLEPPLILVCIARSSATHDRLTEAGRFAVNVLAADQEELAVRFAAEPAAGRFRGVAWNVGPGRVPLLEGVAAWLSCALEAVHPGGDHSIVVGRVEEAAATGCGALAFYRGSFGAAAP